MQQRLAVTERVWNALVIGQQYVFYLAPFSKCVLAIEPKGHGEQNVDPTLSAGGV
jgi:hypothetical protein